MRLPEQARVMLKAVLPRRSRVRLRQLWYLGSRFTCPVCKSKLRTLLPGGNSFPVLRELDVIGGERSVEDVCPVCFSNSRARLVHQFLMAGGVLSDRSGTRVLHIAPERGIAERLMRFGAIEYVAGDLDPQRYDFTAAVRVDVTRMQFSDDSFDLVICNHVLEHIPNDRLAMRELFRVLSPGGSAILQVPLSARLATTLEDPSVTDPRARERVFGQADHVRVYARDYTERLTETGFMVELLDPTALWGGEVIARLRLNPRERLCLGKKPPGEPRPSPTVAEGES